jgi:hypothetical protein
MNVKKKLLALIPFAVALVINFYALPLLIRDTGTAIFILIMLIPLITFICALIYGVRHGFNLIFPIIVAILFAPTIFIFYNTSAWVYIITYAIVALVGNGIGRIFYRKR